MFTLYARKGAGSAAIEAMLALTGAPYAVEDMVRNADGKFEEEFHHINPRAEVPTLRLSDDTIMTESAAILIHLADVFPAAGMAPGITSADRPRYLRWMAYLATTVYMSDLRMYYPQRYTLEGIGAEQIKAVAAQGLADEFAVYADALGAGPFLLGDKISAVDLYTAMLVTWVPDMGELFSRHPNLKAMCDGVAAIPAVAKVWARNGM